MMKILVFGHLKDIIGSASMEIDDVTDTSALHHRLSEIYPSLVNFTFRIAVDGILINGEAPLLPGSTIALLPPFSGG